MEERQRRDGSVRPFIVGFLAGALGAAATSMLYAPRSGEETKAQIRSRAQELRKDAQETIDRSRNSARQLVSEAGMTVADWLDEGSRVLKEEAEELRAAAPEDEVTPV
jgi:gas vesicle protein